MRIASTLLHAVWVGLLAVVLTFTGVGASQAQIATDKPLRVMVRAVAPFVMQNENGKWEGIAVELWDKVAKENGWTYQIEAATIPELLEAVKSGRADVGLGAVSITAEREKYVDFSHPFYRTGLGVAVHVDDTASIWGFVKAVFSPRFIAVIATLFGLLLIVGTLVWFVERKHNPQFSRDPIKGIGAGIWFSGVTMATVGYGDKAPISLAGRALTTIWMFSCLILVSIFTASMTAALTVNAISQRAETESELIKLNIGAVSNSTAEQQMKKRGANTVGYTDLALALAALEKKQIDAVVFDKPSLRHQVNRKFAQSLQVLPLEFEPQDYGIVLPLGSALRKPVNRSLIDAARGQQWDALITGYLGK
jgi:polar amino acid transport system substrate-binding protein